MDRVRALWLRHDKRIKCGRNVIIKPHVEIRIAENGVLELGDNVILDPYVFLQLTKPRPRLILGDHVGIGRHCVLAIKGTTRIGAYTQIGPYCQIIDQGHGYLKDDLIINQPAIVEDVTIGMDCWFGSGVRVLKGVTIHDGAVLGAGSVVTCDIPPYEIWAGVPAAFLKRRP